MSSFIFLILARLIVVFTAMPIHEYAHGLVAYKMGDPTAKWQGRLTLNPIKHIDVVGAIAILIFGIGWAKQVEINPRNFRNPKLGMAISALAGPLSNIFLALIAMILYKIFMLVPFTGNIAPLTAITQLLSIIITVNISLAIFNLLPIPPLDGSRVANYFLPERIYFKIMQYEQYIFLGLILLMSSPILNGPLYMLNNLVFNFLNTITGFIDIFSNMVR